MRSSTDYVNYNDDFVSGFDASTCLSGNVYSIFENQDEIITEDWNIWVKTNGTIWIGRDTKITSIDLPQD